MNAYPSTACWPLVLLLSLCAPVLGGCNSEFDELPVDCFADSDCPDGTCVQFECVPPDAIAGDTEDPDVASPDVDAGSDADVDVVPPDGGDADTMPDSPDIAGDTDAADDVDVDVPEPDVDVAGDADVDVPEVDADAVDPDVDVDVPDGSGDVPLSEQVSIIEPGTATIGSPPGEIGFRPDEGESAQREVTLTRRFAMRRTEVTEAQWVARGGSDVIFAVEAFDEVPATNLTWFASLAFANASSAQDGFDECYTLLPDGCDDDWQEGWTGFSEPTCVRAVWDQTCDGWRLPTETEWEYAARAGTTTATYAGDFESDDLSTPEPALENIAWYQFNSRSRLHQVGALEPNAWGLYDIIGNAWEFVWDGDTETINSDDGLTGGQAGIACGGSHFALKFRTKASGREFRGTLNGTAGDLGLRLVRTLPD